jgi:uncharacterized protein YndB with AHSA1/START domain
MEFGTLEREIHIDAAPEVVFEVVTRPEHLKEWWPDDTDIEPVVGAEGHVVFGSTERADKVVPITVLEVDPPKRFVFRWDYDEGETPVKGNSMRVVFELEPVGDGTLVRLTETGFRERGWEAAVLEEAYRDHSSGWDYFVPRLGSYVDREFAR